MMISVWRRPSGMSLGRRWQTTGNLMRSILAKRPWLIAQRAKQMPGRRARVDDEHVLTEALQTASTAAPATQVAGNAEGAPAGNVGDPGPAGMDERIASALTDDAVRSDAVAALLVEAEAGALAADAVAKTARQRAIDPLLTTNDLKVARGDMVDAEFERDRMAEAARRLGQRLVEVKAIEIARAQRAEHDKWQAERDRLSAKLASLSGPLGEIAALMREIDGCERWLKRLNATTGPTLGFIMPVMAGAGSVVSAVFRDGVVVDSFVAAAAVMPPSAPPSLTIVSADKSAA
jgi:hypothetical protein